MVIKVQCEGSLDGNGLYLDSIRVNILVIILSCIILQDVTREAV